MSRLFEDKEVQSKAARLSREIEEDRINRSIYHTFVTHAPGKETLELLRVLFYDKSTYARGDQVHSTYQQGQQDVVGFILESIKAVERESA